MYDFFWFSDSQQARIAPLLPTDVRGKKRVDDHRVLSGIVHALRCGGRRAERAVYGKVSSALRQAPRIRLTGCSSTVPTSRFIATAAIARAAALISWLLTRPDPNPAFPMWLH